MSKNNVKKDSEMMSEDMCCGGGDCRMGYCGYGYGHSPAKGFVKLTAGLLFLMLSLWVGLQIFGNPWYKNIRAEFTATPYARTITVDGEGKITVKPDIAKISLAVASTGKTVQEVTEDSNKKMNLIISELKNLGIKAEDIQTSGYNLYPEYDYNRPPIVINGQSSVVPSKVPAILGYTLNQTVDVKVRDLTKTEQVIDRATKAGANQIGALTFDLDDASKIKKEAREMAFGKAKEKAQEMASAAGVRLGRVVTFSEGFGGYPMPYANFAVKSMDMAESAAPAIEPGSKEFNVNVSVTYEIE